MESFPISSKMKIQLYNFIKNISKHKSAALFTKSIDASALGITDYYQYIKEPMDLYKIKVMLLII